MNGGYAEELGEEVFDDELLFERESQESYLDPKILEEGTPRYGRIKTMFESPERQSS